MKTIDKIITNVSAKFGAPMGRANVGTEPTDKKVFDCYVPMSNCGAYDKGGVYWGCAIHGVKPLRVAYTKDLSYINFYRAHHLTGFNEWMKDGNAERIGENKFIEQTTQWKKEFTLNELKQFYAKEYFNITLTF